MTLSATVLFATNFKSWIGARGFIMVIAAAMVPLLLTGAWVATHQVDVAATSVTWSPTPAVEGTPINITATFENKGRFDVGRFNATLTVGRVSGSRLVAEETTTTNVEGLKAGATTTLVLEWTPTPGYFVVLADADAQDALTELEEFNNQRPEWLEVHYVEPGRELGPKAPENLTGGGPTGDLAVTNVTWTPVSIVPGSSANLTATIQNLGSSAVQDANLTFRVGQVFGDQLFENQGVQRNISLGPGETTNVTFEWRNVPSGVFWAQAFLNSTGVASETNVTNNHVTEPFLVHLIVPPEAKFPDPPEKVTIKRFYVDVIGLLQIRILIPFIAIFYAAGVIADERDKGNLTYLLTRPVQRWLLPITKFVAGFAAASVAVGIGILLTFFLLLGTPEGKDIGFLVTPLLISLVSLLVYGCVFILVSVTFDRPYLVGLALVAWEWLVQVGELFEVEGRSVVAPWVKNVTLSFHLGNAFEGWKLDSGVQWLPEGSGVEALRNVVLAAAAALILAAVIVRRREFDV